MSKQVALIGHNFAMSGGIFGQHNWEEANDISQVKARDPAKQNKLP